MILTSYPLKQVQVAQVMGKPTPQPPKNTGTPPLILRMPVSSDEEEAPNGKISIKNVTAIVSAVSRHFILSQKSKRNMVLALQFVSSSLWHHSVTAV